MSDYLEEIAEIARREARGGMTAQFATVTQVSPLQIRFDGETTSYDGVPMNFVGEVSQGQRVLTVWFDRRLAIVGAANGAGVPPHTHRWVDVTEKPTAFPPEGHSHSLGDIESLSRNAAGNRVYFGNNPNSATSDTYIALAGKGDGTPLAAWLTTTDRTVFRWWRDGTYSGGADTDWTNFSYNSGWSLHGGTPGWCIRNGWVHLRGSIQGPISGSLQGVLTLPAAARPSVIKRFTCPGTSGRTSGIEINTAGILRVYSAWSSPPGWFGLDGVAYPLT